MAPRGSKRSAGAAQAGAGAAAKKRRPAANPVLQKCGLIVGALSELDAAVLPAGPAELLASLVEGALATPKADRHAFQARVVGMVDEAMQSAKGFLEKSAEEGKAKTQAVLDDKAKRQEALAAAKGEVVALETVVADKKEALAAVQAAASKSREDYAAEQKKQKEADAPFEAAQQDLADAKRASEVLETLKLMSTESKQAKLCLDKLLGVGKRFNFDASLVDSLCNTLRKEPADRTDFDLVVTQNIEEALGKLVLSFEETLAAGAAPRQACAAATAAAEAALQAAEQAISAAKAEVVAAQDAVKAGNATIKTAHKAVGRWLLDAKVVMDAFDETEVVLTNFKTGPLAAFEELKELVVEPEEPKKGEAPPADEGAPEAAGEAAPEAVAAA